MHILILINTITNTCGVSSHVYNLISKLKVSANDLNITIMCGGGDECRISDFKKLGLNVIIYASLNHNKRNYIGYLKAIFKVIVFCVSNEVDIIHSHHHYASNIAFYATKLLKLKSLLTIHGIIQESGKLNHFTADYLIAPSQKVKNYLINNKIKDPSKIYLINNGVNESKACNRHNKKIKIIAASRMIKLKALDIYIQSVAAISPKYYDKAEFYLAGEGINKSNLLQLISDTGAKIKYVGNIIKFNVELCGFHIFVFPSTMETFPMSLLEAGMAKTLIITADYDGLAEYFTEFVDGLVFQKNNIPDLTEKIIYAIDHYEEHKYMINNFYEKVRSFYNRKLMSERTLQLYRKIVNDIL